MGFPRFSRIYFQFLLPVTLIAVFPLLFLGIGIARMDRKILVSQTARELSSLASIVENELRLTMDDLLRDAEVAASLPGIVSMDKMLQEEVLRQIFLHDSRLSYIDILNAEGILTASSHHNRRPFPPGAALGEAAGGLQSWTFYTDPVDHRNFLVIHTPIRDVDRNITGILTGFVNLLDLNHIVDKVQAGRSRAILVDSFGCIILHPDRDLILSGAAGPWQERLLKKELVGNGTTSYLIGGEKYDVGFSTLVDHNWTVLIERPDTELTAQAQRAYTFTLVAVMITTLAVLAALLWLAGRLTGPIRNLSLVAREFAAGNAAIPLPRYPSDKDEIGSLIIAFGEMRETLSRKTKELQINEERYRSLFETVGDAIFIYDPDTFEIMEANEATARIYGYSREELIGMSCLKFSAEEEDSKAVGRIIKEEGNAEVPIRHHKSKNGSDLYIQLSGYRAAVGDQEVMFSVCRDITARLKAEQEKEKLQEELFQMQKLESIGQLAGGIAHDFNNQLTGIIGYAELLKPGLEDDVLIRYADNIRRGAQNSATLTQQLLSFARKGQYTLQPLDLHDVMDEVISIMTRTLDRRIQVHRIRNASVLTVQGDKNQIQNALLNIALNARDAITGAGMITFESGLLDIKENSRNTLFDLPPGEYVRISIKDDGCGMDEELQKHIFEPFYTTKEVGKGTGMGLSAAYGTVKLHGGDIFLESGPRQGSTFHILLPRSKSQKDGGGTSGSAGTTPDAAHILIIDDDEIIRGLLSELLGSQGYRIRGEADGESGMNYYRQNAEKIDLVILDMIMPRINGGEVFKAIKDINPRAKIIISSGYSPEDDSISKIVRQGIPYIQKPCSLSDMSELVAKTLGSRV
jgi:two-component system, cell cycle sensor histidine kinase and response regulator CckA